MKDQVEYIRSKYDILLFKSLISLDEAKNMGEPIYAEDDRTVLAYYISGGFKVHTCFLSKSDANAQMTMNRIAYTLAELNPDVDILHLLMYLEALAERDYNVKISSSMLLSCLLKSAQNEVPVEPFTRKFFWVGDMQFAKLSEKRAVYMPYINRATSVQNVMLVEEKLTDIEENNIQLFITGKYIERVTGLSYPTVLNILPQFRDRIDRHNRAVCMTDNFNEFRKSVNVSKIVLVIESYIDAGDSRGLNKRAIGRDADVHYQTVNNLWYEEDVVIACDKYNEWLTSKISA